MGEDDAPVPRPDGAGRLHKFLLLVGQHLPARQAGHADPAQHAQGDEQEEQPAHRLVDLHHSLAQPSDLPGPLPHTTEVDLHDDDQRQGRDAVQKVHKAHHQVVNAPAVVAGDHAVNQADQQRH